MWNGCSTQARTCDSALSTASAQSRRALGKALMMPRLIAMFQETSQSSSSGRLFRPGIAGIGEDSLLPAVQQGRRLVDVGFVGGGGARDVCTTPEATSTPICAFIPKCHW